MKSKFTLITFLLVFTLFNCKKQNSFSNYKYGEKPEVIACNGLSKLYNEALYSFENDLLSFYQRTNPKTTLLEGYSQFIRAAIYGRLKLEDMLSKQSIEVFEALKSEDDLWDATNTKSHLNYKGKALSCIGANIKDDKLKTTFTALISTNSMSPKLFGAPLMSKYRNALNDKYLALYIALDMYYSNIFDVDVTQINLDRPEPKVDFNKVPQKAPITTGSGH